VKEYNDPVQEWPPEEVVVKVEDKKEEGDDNADKKEEENKEEDETEKKFNPKEFQWTLSNGNPKTCSQIFNKMKPANWVNLIVF